MNTRSHLSLTFFVAFLLSIVAPAAAQQVKWAVRHDTSPTAIRNVDPSDVSTATEGVESSEENGPVLSGGSSSASVLQSSDGSVSDDGPGENFDGLGVQDGITTSMPSLN